MSNYLKASPVAWVALAALLALALPAQAACEALLVIKGILGESQDRTYTNSIDCLAWAWGMSQSYNMHSSESNVVSRSSFQDLSITKYVDKASPLLMQSCAQGTVIADAQLIVRHSGASTNTYFKISLRELIIASVSTSGSGGEDRLTETITLNFAKVMFEYFPINPDGTQGSGPQFLWDIRKSQKSFD